MHGIALMLALVAPGPQLDSDPAKLAAPDGSFDYTKWSLLFEPYVSCMRDTASRLEPSGESAEAVAATAETFCANHRHMGVDAAERLVREFNLKAPVEKRVSVESMRRSTLALAERGKVVATRVVVVARAERAGN